MENSPKSDERHRQQTNVAHYDFDSRLAVNDSRRSVTCNTARIPNARNAEQHGGERMSRRNADQTFHETWQLSLDQSQETTPARGNTRGVGQQFEIGTGKRHVLPGSRHGWIGRVG